jgi:hypothetical protein
MTGTEYLDMLERREYAARTRLAMAMTLHQGYNAAVLQYESTHGSRPTGWLERMMPGIAGWAQLDAGWARRMSDHFDQLRIAVNRGIEWLNRSSEVTAPIPANLTARYQQLRRMCLLGSEQLTWYLNAPVSRVDPRRPAIERMTRGAIATYPGWSQTLRSAGQSEGAFSREVTREMGAGVPEMPSQAAIRTGAGAAEHAAAQTAGTVGDPHGTLAVVGREAQEAGKHIEAAAGAATRFVGRGARTLRNITPGAGRAGGEGLRWSDLLVIGGVGAVAVGGVYLFLKTRPSLIAAGTALKALKRNPDGTIEYIYEDEDCG